jgi:hypothetical protein
MASSEESAARTANLMIAEHGAITAAILADDLAG